MKLENQVCFYEQAEALFKLGVKQQSAFFFVRTASKSGQKNCELFFGMGAAMKQYNQWVQHDGFLTSKTDAPIAAFTDAELDAMLPREYVQPRSTAQLFTYKVQMADRLVYACSVPIAGLIKQLFHTGASLRAAILIHLLEHEMETIDNVNNRLTFA